MEGLPEMVYAVDDDQSFLKALIRLLQTVGIKAEGFSSAKKLAERVPLSKHACLVIDIFLDRENGLDVPQQLRELGEDTPFVFVSATEDEDLLARAEKLSGQPCLHKPFEIGAFSEALQLAMQLHKQ